MPSPGPQQTKEQITRRRFSRELACASLAVLISRQQARSNEKESAVALVQGSERPAAIDKAIESLGGIDCRGSDVVIKGSFNSPHPFPATTHPETLARIVGILRGRNCGAISLIERSGMGNATEIWRKLGTVDLARHLKIRLISLDDLPAADWRHEEMPGSHWRKGVEVPRMLRRGEVLIQICNLKTHRFGGHFSACLKNSIGMIAKYSPTTPHYNYMAELHSSPDQRLMIAEVNTLFQPQLLLMDAMEVFTQGGPEAGDVAAPGVVAASLDPVALDAVGLSLLRLHDEAPQQIHAPVFEDDQIKRAAELGLGAKSGDQISLRTGDQPSGNLALQLRSMLNRQAEESKR
jgi:uncharacterized protein (DUF362 family)